MDAGRRRAPCIASPCIAASCFPAAALKKPHLQRALQSFFENKMIKGYLPSHPTSDTSRAASLLSPPIMHAAFPQLPVLHRDGSYNPRIKSEVRYGTSKRAPRLGQACSCSLFILYLYLFIAKWLVWFVRQAGGGNTRDWWCWWVTGTLSWTYE